MIANNSIFLSSIALETQRHGDTKKEFVSLWLNKNTKTQKHKEEKMQREAIYDDLNQVSKQIVDAAFTVHSALGAGLLESVYEVCLEYELTKRGFRVQRQLVLPIMYDKIKLEAGFRLDLLVNECVIVEVKAVETLLPVHTAQVITYLKLSQHRLALLINFNVPLIKDGIKRIVL